MGKRIASWTHPCFGKDLVKFADESDGEKLENVGWAFVATTAYDVNNKIIFKDEEGGTRSNGDKTDMYGTPALIAFLRRMAELVVEEFYADEKVAAWIRAYELRVTESWDLTGEHSARSLHYVGRAADLSTHAQPTAAGRAELLGRLSALAVKAGAHWVWHEPSHVHMSVTVDPKSCEASSDDFTDAATWEAVGSISRAPDPVYHSDMSRDGSVVAIAQGDFDDDSWTVRVGPALGNTDPLVVAEGSLSSTEYRRQYTLTETGNTEFDASQIMAECSPRVALDATGDTLAIGLPCWGDPLSPDPSIQGQVVTLRFVDDTWTRSTTLFGNFEARLGRSLALSDDGLLLAVGAPGGTILQRQSGRVELYRFIDTAWQAAETLRDPTVVDPDELVQNYFGWDLAMSSDGSVLATASAYVHRSEAPDTPARIWTFRSGSGSVDLDPLGDAPQREGLLTIFGLSADGSTLAVQQINSGNVRDPVNPFVSSRTTTDRVRVYRWADTAWALRYDPIPVDLRVPEVPDFLPSCSALAVSDDGAVVAVGHGYSRFVADGPTSFRYQERGGNVVLYRDRRQVYDDEELPEGWTRQADEGPYNGKFPGGERNNIKFANVARNAGVEARQLMVTSWSSGFTGVTREQSWCYDAPGWFLGTDPMMDCSYIAERPIDRCFMKSTDNIYAKDACPLSCGTCQC